MKRIRRLIPLALTALTALTGLTGCMSTSDKITGPGVNLNLPKDAQFSYLEYKSPVVMTNGQVGQVSLIISNGVFKMNPDVIDAKTRRDIALIQTGASAAGQLGAQAVSAAAGVPK